jgi:hypothetical protein
LHDNKIKQCSSQNIPPSFNDERLYISQLCHLRELENIPPSQGHIVAISWFSNTLPSIKGAGLLGQILDSRTRAENTQDEIPFLDCLTVPENKEVLKKKNWRGEGGTRRLQVWFKQ